MGNQTTNVTPATGIAALSNTAGIQVAGSTNSNTDLAASLNNQGAYGYVNVWQSVVIQNPGGATTNPLKFNMPNSLGSAQIRTYQFLCDCEAGYGTTSLPIGFVWYWIPGANWAAGTSTGNVYAFSSNSTAPGTFQYQAPTGGTDTAGAGAMNSSVFNVQTITSGNFTVRQTNAGDWCWRGFPEWVSTIANSADLAAMAAGHLASPFVCGYALAGQAQAGLSVSNAIADMSVTDVSLTIGTGTAPVPAQGANVKGPMYLQVGYNQAPTATVNIGGSTGTVNLLNLTPTVSWAYSDPENDPQVGFVVLLWPNGQNANTGPVYSLLQNQISGNPYPVVAPSWSSGLVTSSANSYTIPAGVLQPGQSYTIQVLVTDSGSQGRYSSYSGGTINVTTSYSPILTPDLQPQFTIGGISQPSYAVAPTLGYAAKVPVKPRINNQTFTASMSNVNTSVTSTSWTGNQTGCAPQDLITGLVDVQVSANRTLTLTLTFFNSSNVSIGTASRTAYGYGVPTPAQPTVTVVGTAGSTTYSYAVTALNAIGETAASTVRVITNSNATLNGTNFNTISWTAVTGATSYNVYRTDIASNTVLVGNTASTTINDQANTHTTKSFPTTTTAAATVKCWVQAWSPVGTASAQLSLSIPGYTAGDTILLGHQSISNGNINLLDNSDFENGSFFWTSSLTASGTATTVTGSSTGDSDEVNESMGTTVMQFTTTTNSDAASITPTDGPSLHGSTFLLSTNINFTGTLTMNASAVTAGLLTPASTVTGTGVWNRKTQTVTATSLATTDLGRLFFGLPLSSGAATAQIDNLILQPVWPTVNLTMAAGTTGQNLPATVPLGSSSNTLGWFAEGGASASTKWDNTHVHNAETVSLEITGTGKASQIFTVSGYTQVAFNHYYYQTSGAVTMTVTYYSAGGIPLYVSYGGSYVQSVTVTSATLNAWTQSSTATIPVPSQAAFAKVTFTTTGTAWLTDVTITPTGSLAPMPYLNGGWSIGMSDINPYVVLQRSADNGVTWTTLRYYNSVSAIGQTFFVSYGGVYLSPGELTYYDMEYTPIAAGTTDTTTSRVIYSAYTLTTYGTYATTGPTSSLRSFYRPTVTDFWLIDPINTGDSMIVPVKTFKASRTENLTKQNGLGRKRVVVIGDVVQGDILSLTTQSLSAAEWAALQVQMDKQSALVFRSPDGEMWYVRFTKRDRERVWTGNYGVQLRTHTLELQEVDPLA